jgi:hypothetical protein
VGTDDEEVVAAMRSWQVGVAGMLLILGACGRADAGNPVPSTSGRGGALELAVSQTCTPGSRPDCTAVADEHVVVTPSGFARIGVTSATPAADGSAAVYVVLDTEGARAFSAIAGQVAEEEGDGGRLVLRVDGEVLSAVRVPEPMSLTRLEIAVPDHLRAEDVARQINDG